MLRKLLNGVVALLVVALLVGTIGGRHLIRDSQEVVVKKTEQRCEQGSACRYLVFTDKGVFENVDSHLELKWNSSDLYGELVVGQKFRIDYYGVRFGFFSMYPNIVGLEKL